MKQIVPSKVIMVPKKSSPPAVVSRDDVHARARELALLEGRTPPDVVQADYEQAKREMTGETDPIRQEAVLNAPIHTIPNERLGKGTPAGRITKH